MPGGRPAGPGAAVTGVGLFTPAGADRATTWETVRVGKPTAGLEERDGLRYLACRAPELPGGSGGLGGSGGSGGQGGSSRVRLAVSTSVGFGGTTRPW
ncbi:hypothetical protein [Streptomyces sp. WAC01280]|uniref:hypothetical protein n=1 Tax=Streptomyces sp. WAC01280 TaxID=2487424 RepID=UPI000F78095C|nr:hypothetical protein [Streptomyces sp. WAC01280]RSS53314.1 hypothetical protein EF909_27900 [Streptomyces sp. WAC01280]